MADESKPSFFRRLLGSLHNRISLVGVALTTASAFTMLWSWTLELLGTRPSNPYVGIILFLILPGGFVFGLILIPLGIWLRRRRLKKTGEVEPIPTTLDLGSKPLRRILTFVGVATVANVALVGVATAKGVHYMDSNEFCGKACHTVMAPEYTAFLDSPHAKVGCAQCHIGPGADWFVKAKISGTRQLFAMALKNYSRPVPSPVAHLRPARETCEQCHWPQKFHGDKLQIRTTYGDDEANTPNTTILQLRLGGTSWKGTQGIHGQHLDATSRIQYVSTDPKRHEIPKVIYRDDQGKLVEYFLEDAKQTPDQLAKLPTRSMDCVDCHNRPTHAFDLPDAALDKAFNQGRLSPDLPFLKKTGLELLQADYGTREAAQAQIPAKLEAFYKEKYPELLKTKAEAIKTAGATIRDIHLRNIWPDMKITWGTHANHIGHANQLGCFRCHDGAHTSKDGKTISSDCATCHAILAQGPDAGKMLGALGLK